MPHKVWALVSFFLPIKIQIFIMHQLLCDALSRKKTLVICILLKEKWSLSEETKSAWSFGKFIFNENWGFTVFENNPPKKFVFDLTFEKLIIQTEKNMNFGQSENWDIFVNFQRLWGWHYALHTRVKDDTFKWPRS